MKVLHYNFYTVLKLIFVFSLIIPTKNALADSVNSPNITLNVDTNRSTGAGAGNVAVTINTITLAEITLPEYSSDAGGGKTISIKTQPGYQFDPSSSISAQSATIGFNGGGLNAASSVVPTGAANEVITFQLTSGTNTNVQDIIRINGVKIKILNALGAAGPAKTTMALTSSTAGGAFTNQGIVAANITRGAGDRLIFSIQPGTNQASRDLLPEVKVVDFGGNVLNTDTRTISLALQQNPGSATLQGTATRAMVNGVATWADADNLNLTVAANGYSLRASHNGTSLLTSNTVDSAAFNITAGDPGGIVLSNLPTSITAGGDITLDATVVDEFDNPITGTNFDITLDSAVNPGGWPLLVDTSLTKTTSNGVASWTAADHLRINKAVTGYKLSASGFGAPAITSTFDINPGTANGIRFVQQPSDVLEDAVMSPAVTTEIIDAFGNRITNSTATVEISVLNGPCGGNVSNNSKASVAGVATFDALSFDTPCTNNVLQGSSSGLAGVVSESFNVTSKNALPIAINSTQLKKGKLFKFSSNGSFSLPTGTNDDPTKSGGSLVVTGTTGAVTYPLPKKGWKKTGASGFQFKSKKCESVQVKNNKISATCEAKTGSLQLPETELDIVVNLGTDGAKFCGECGGTSVGNASKIFKRSNCSAPVACQ